MVKEDSKHRVLNGFVHNFIPSSYREVPVLLLLHGTGGNEDDLIPLGRELGQDNGLLSPRGRVLEGTMPRFFRRFVEGEFDIEDLKLRTNELADFVISASKEYSFDPKSMVAVSYSNGANIAASMLLLRPEIISSAVLFRAMLPLVPDKLPDLSKKLVFISSGTYDQVVPRKQVVELEQLLRRFGASVTLNWVRSDHSLVEEEIKDARKFLETHGSLRN